MAEATRARFCIRFNIDTRSLWLVMSEAPCVMLCVLDYNAESLSGEWQGQKFRLKCVKEKNLCLS